MATSNADKPFRFIFIGTGTSEGIPRVSCLVKGECETCKDAMRVSPSGELSKNRRFNTSAVIQFEGKNLLIDCGKFFWQSALHIFPRYNINTLHAIALSHEHCDAAFGLDDLRDLTIENPEPLPIYIRPQDVPTVTQTFPYLFKNAEANIKIGGGVSKVILKPLESATFEPFPGLQLTCLPVAHGPNGCNGFRIGPIAYVSDAKEIPDSTRALMQGCRVLVIDCLRVGPEHGTHFLLDESIAEVRKLSPLPEIVYLVGMTHDLEHEATNLLVKEMAPDLNIQLAYDGLALDLHL
eukprot:GILI01026356.1.p1 GENE.GILI01026356.1~~GILI01026356.1.p1  ORF type:complete len:294 (+),score=68.32 GILI01026356.1:27-908(+)